MSPMSEDLKCPQIFLSSLGFISLYLLNHPGTHRADKRRLEKMRSFIVLQLFSFVWTGSFQPETESCWGSFKLNGNKNFQHQRGRTSLGERRKVCL